METKVHVLRAVEKQINKQLIDELQMMLELAQRGEINDYVAVYSVSDTVSLYVNECDYRFACLASVLLANKAIKLLGDPQ